MKTRSGTPVWLLALALAAGAADAFAGCSRPLIVPASPIGMTVTVKGDEVGGAFPEVLNEAAAKAGCTLVYSVVPRARLEHPDHRLSLPW